MTTYTAEDFADAEIARHPDGAVAERFGYLSQRQWRTEAEWLSDGEMACDGWVPVREAADQPITLDALRDAWESAEVADECNKGDVLIYRHPASESEKVEVWVAGRPGRMRAHVRILRRAPKPQRSEGAERPEALLRALVGDPALLADWLAERGVPVTEEGEK